MLGSKLTAPLIPAVLLALFATACDDDSLGVGSPDGAANSGLASVRVLLTDAPADYIAAASVDIGLVELISVDGEHVLLSDDGTDGFVNLLDFQGPATRPIAEADIDPGSFTQLRLVVEAARVELAPGYAFRDGSTEMDLKVPSGAQTGIKLNLHDADDSGPLTIVPGETVLVLDFDVSKSFVLQGNPVTPAGIHGVIFTPTIRVTGEDVAASISGTVTTAVAGVSVEGLTVTAEPTNGGTVPGYQTWAGTATTDMDGNYTIYFLVPGSYEVSVDLDPGFVTDPPTRSVDLAYSENATGADFEILDVRGSISGTVTTALAGASVEDLTVTGEPQTAGLDPLMATTAADGTYMIDLVVPGSYVVTVEVGTDQVTDPVEHEVDVGNNEDVTGVDFEVVEDVSGSIAGTVTTALPGVTVEGLTVTAAPAAAGASPVMTATDADGEYSFPSLQPDTYTLTVTVPAGLATAPPSLEVVLADNGEETGADFDVIQAP